MQDALLEIAKLELSGASEKEKEEFHEAIATLRYHIAEQQITEATAVRDNPDNY